MNSYLNRKIDNSHTHPSDSYFLRSITVAFLALRICFDDLFESFQICKKNTDYISPTIFEVRFEPTTR
jgi:hypothetical protein